MTKKTYSAPQLISYGELHSLTKGGTSGNSDVPRGPNNTAYPPKGAS